MSIDPSPSASPAPTDGGPRIALVYFGITRSLRLTIGSIRQNLLGPAQALTPDLRQFGHFYLQDRIENPRSRESGPLDPEEYRLLNLDAVEREAPGQCLDAYDFDRVAALGDPWDDGFVSLRNLVHQLHSLKRATLMALDWRPDVVIFARPDLYYHATVPPYLRELVRRRLPWALVPDWANWRGLNDRFAIVQGEAAIRAYGLRADRIAEFCAKGDPLHAERFLDFALKGCEVCPVPMHASRVRSHGSVLVEDFSPGRGRGGDLATLPFAEFEQKLTLARAGRAESEVRHG